MADAAWWKTAVIYELLVPSFQDSNGDGWGDLPGITQRLDYLQDLGVDAVWLSPINPSPLYDIGYDVSDYTAIHPRFGTLADFDRLIAEAHRRRLRIIIDFVPNHTSVEHPWFQQSRQSRDNPQRPWYLWSDPGVGGGPPNNWINRFGETAWTLDEATGQYYFGSFTSQQPDLNWRNPEVRQAIAEAMHFWLRRGVDGLRIDALAHLIKDEHLRNNPRNLDYTEDLEPNNKLCQVYHQNQPELLDRIEEFRALFDQYEDRVILGEVYQSAEQITAYQRAGAHLLLSTSMLQSEFETAQQRNVIDLAEGRTAVGAWPSRSSGNHDIPRLATRVGQKNLRLAALLHFTVRGTPTMYYGEELGLCDMQVPADRLQDPAGKADIRYGRDGYRAPMPWDDSPGAGFTGANTTPWLPMDEATRRLHVAGQLRDPQSLLNFYRRVLRLRSQEPALRCGDYAPLETPEPVLAFVRGAGTGELLIAANLCDQASELDLEAIGYARPGNQRIFSTLCEQRLPLPAVVSLRPREGIIIRLQESQHERSA